MYLNIFRFSFTVTRQQPHIYITGALGHLTSDLLFKVKFMLDCVSGCCSGGLLFRCVDLWACLTADKTDGRFDRSASAWIWVRRGPGWSELQGLKQMMFCTWNKKRINLSEEGRFTHTHTHTHTHIHTPVAQVSSGAHISAEMFTLESDLVLSVWWAWARLIWWMCCRVPALLASVHCSSAVVTLEESL